MRVEDVMTQGVRTVTPDTPIKEVAVILSELRIGGVPVVDDDGAPLGVISKADILIKERAESPGAVGGSSGAAGTSPRQRRSRRIRPATR